jgi:hypothetical protein
MEPIETAAGARTTNVFRDLARSRGLAVRTVAAAAEADRLGDVLRLPAVGPPSPVTHVRRLAALHARRDGAPPTGRQALDRMAERRHAPGTAEGVIAAKRAALADRHRVVADWDAGRRQWRVTDPHGRVGYGATIEDACEDWLAGIGA